MGPLDRKWLEYRSPADDKLKKIFMEKINYYYCTSFFFFGFKTQLFFKEEYKVNETFNFEKKKIQ